jgi:phospholipid/cholesterol/gamma-HCH transport system permease protein
VIGALGKWTLLGLRWLGAGAVLSGRVIARLPRMRGRELVRSAARLGADSAPLVLLAAVVTGMMMVLQTQLYVERYGARAFLGWAASFAVLWEFGPLLLGLMLAARAGAQNAAELAALSASGHLEGLEGVALDPIALLVAPRMTALLAASAALSALFFLVAIGFEMTAAMVSLRLPPMVFLGSVRELLGPRDLLAGVIKSTAFGSAVAVISSLSGLRARGGARAVGEATARSVQRAAAAIFGLDFVLTQVLTPLLGGPR